MKTQNVVVEPHTKFHQLVHQSNEFAQEGRTGNDGVLNLAILVEEIFDLHKKLESGYLGTRELVGSIQESLNQLGNVSAQFRREDRETLDASSLEVTRLGEMMAKMDVSGANLHQLEHDYQEMHGWVPQALYKHERLEGEGAKMAMQAHEWDNFFVGKLHNMEFS